MSQTENYVFVWLTITINPLNPNKSPIKCCKHPVKKKHMKICFSQPVAVYGHMGAVKYSQALPHYVPCFSERQIPLPRCLSRSPSVCSGLAKVTHAAEGSLQPWATNWPGNVRSPVPPPPTYPIVNQPWLSLNVPSVLPLGRSYGCNVKKN